MPIGKSGEIFGDWLDNREQINFVDELFYMSEAFGAQSTLPYGINKPKDIFYWKGERLEHYKELLQKMKELAAQNKTITVLTHPGTGEKIVLSEFFRKIENSISFSEKINI